MNCPMIALEDIKKFCEKYKLKCDWPDNLFYQICDAFSVLSKYLPPKFPEYAIYKRCDNIKVSRNYDFAFDIALIQSTALTLTSLDVALLPHVPTDLCKYIDTFIPKRRSIEPQFTRQNPMLLCIMGFVDIYKMWPSLRNPVSATVGFFTHSIRRKLGLSKIRQEFRNINVEYYAHSVKIIKRTDSQFHKDLRKILKLY